MRIVPATVTGALLALLSLVTPAALAVGHQTRPCGSERADYVGTFQGTYVGHEGSAELKGDGTLDVTVGNRKASGTWAVGEDWNGRKQLSARIGVVGLFAYPECREGGSRVSRLEIPPNSRTYVTRIDQ